MRKLYLVIVSVLLAAVVNAQKDPALEFSATYNEHDKGMTISVNKQKPGTYTVFLEFTSLINCSEAKSQIIKVRDSGPVLTLRPIVANEYVKCTYTTRSIRGEVGPNRVDTNFVYRLPCRADKKIIVRELSNLDEKMYNATTARNWKAFQFIMERDDTVYAMRKGTVVGIVDTYDATPQANISYTNKSNSIIVEHKDGTRAYYSVMRKGGFMVEEGDTVYPNTPLGIAGSYDDKKHEVRATISYLVSNDSTHPKFKDYPTATVYINPVFATTQGNIRLEKSSTYTSVESPELIKAEMTKREIKQLKQ